MKLQDEANALLTELETLTKDADKLTDELKRRRLILPVLSLINEPGMTLTQLNDYLRALLNE